MAVWTVGIVAAMWRYLDEGKDRYLYIASALLALMFATKETSFLITATLGLFLFLTVVADNWGRVGRRMTYMHVSASGRLLPNGRGRLGRGPQGDRLLEEL